MRCGSGGRFRSSLLGRDLCLVGAGLLGESLGGLEGINLRLVWILLNDLVGLAGPVFEDGYVLQIIDVNPRNHEIYI